ncbi:MAG TPA: septum formation initiator family protein [Kouleothrix sp.]|uniref:FtsB family cell division protein n=1 Tax=Kouleothrix sp. TaxID=2779161 RepID=UPI002BEBD947|nr:septum formation initiator family protein [Kouleothrix sp.]HRC76335.1 septum formation initiator family protein [Kouleothrix sp.]
MRLLTLVLVALSLWTLSGFVGQVLTSAQMDRSQAELRAQNDQIATENAMLATQVAEAQSPAYAERILREQRGYAREGDTVILPSFPQVTPTAAQPASTPAPTVAPAPNWRRWFEALFPPRTP